MSDHGKSSFFLHEHNNVGEAECWFGYTTLENYHCNFWYTTNVSPVKYFFIYLLYDINPNVCSIRYSGMYSHSDSALAPNIS
ncbi:hypothetical protein JVT61DRAFT_1686 [Boletus reticuloceps]|uniref:Uncharacterized protein n=1 Tax=Boletus reticuloceps TaxID=495285 RepID=A0A8I2YR45_9AGAM|nr:hypothetical protein JVT61DRAFT_1686 [Boletus reticuloceps]